MAGRSESGVYVITSPSGKAYIGSTNSFKMREYNHFNDLKNGKHCNFKLTHAWNKHGNDLKFSVLEKCDVGQMIEREQYWIDKYIAEGIKLYNIKVLAGSQTPMTEETKRRLSVAKTGKRHSPETIEKLKAPKPEGFGSKVSAGMKASDKNNGWNDNESRRVKAAETASAVWAKSDSRKVKQSKRLNDLWSDPEHVEMRVNAMKKSWTDEKRAAYREKMKSSPITKWSDERKAKQSAMAKKQRLREHMEMLDWIVGGMWAPKGPVGQAALF